MADTTVTQEVEMASISTDTARKLLYDICQNMMAVKELLELISSKGEFDHAHTAIESLVNHSGAYADKILKELKITPCVGSMEDWYGE